MTSSISDRDVLFSFKYLLFFVRTNRLHRTVGAFISVELCFFFLSFFLFSWSAYRIFHLCISEHFLLFILGLHIVELSSLHRTVSRSY